MEDGAMDAKGSFMRLTLSLWGIDIAAVLLSMILTIVIASASPFLSVVFSEWGIVAESAYLQTTVYILIWLALYTVFLLPSYFLFKRKIIDKIKEKKLFASFMITSVAVRTLFLAIFSGKRRAQCCLI